MIIDAIKPEIPAMVQNLAKISQMFVREARIVTDNLIALMNDIQMQTIRTTKHYDDVYEKYENHRQLVNVIVLNALIVVR